MNKKVFRLVWCVIAVSMILCGYSKKGKDMTGNVDIYVESTDKAMYTPGDDIAIKLQMHNNKAKKIKKAKLITEIYHLGNIVYTDKKGINLDKKEEKRIECNWVAPYEDYKGYMACFYLVDKKGRRISTIATVGIDVSSDWVKFPRYGYVCEYDENQDVDTKIEQMNRFHINGIEYYDWHALHHEPLPDYVTRDNLGVWEDWAGRKIYGNTVKAYIDKAHSKNMVNMAYNMIYAATDSLVKNFENTDIDASKWQLFFKEDSDRGSGEFTFHMGTSPSGNGNLFFMNPLNQEWQNYIFAQENHIFDVIDFDGWHGDTVGDWGPMVTADGEPLGYDENGEPIYCVKDTYKEFLDSAKEALGDKYLSFNPVGAQGIEEANKSDVDVLYTEFWPWDSDRNGVGYNTYNSLVTEVERSMQDSIDKSFDQKGKSLTVKAYINYNLTTGEMNPAGVLLCDAAVYAAGGNRLEIGNGDHMLHKEYYPEDDVLMSEDLKQDMMNMADFVVAYENILRDGQVPTTNKVVIDGYASTSDGQSDTIWTHTKEDDEYEIVHLINLLGTDNEWRDENGNKSEPTSVENITVKYYTDKEITEAYLASYSIDDGMSNTLSYETGEDGDGRYIEFIVPSLEYWDMIYMR